MNSKEFFIIVGAICASLVACGVIMGDGLPEKVPSSNDNSCMDKVYAAAKMPDVGGLKCLLTEYNRCPKFDGSYKQCTNNYVPTPKYGNCPCHNRTFEMCPQKWKVAESVYEEGAAACEPEKVDTYNPETPSDKSRINLWRYDGEVPKSFLVQCQGNCKVIY